VVLILRIYIHLLYSYSTAIFDYISNTLYLQSITAKMFSTRSRLWWEIWGWISIMFVEEEYFDRKIREWNWKYIISECDLCKFSQRIWFHNVMMKYVDLMKIKDIWKEKWKLSIQVERKYLEITCEKELQ
jgi:hypothetical protein